MSEIERDHEVDAAWRAASREEPPPALDAAIRAEARRAVGAAPGRRRNKHWWYPLAAAATVAVLAVSIVQLMPPEQVTPTVVAEQSAAPRAARNEVARQSAGADARLAAPRAPAPSAPTATPAPPVIAPAAPKREQGGAQGTIERERAAAPVQAPEALTKKQLAEAKEEAPARAKLAQPPPEKPDAAPAATFGGVTAPSLPRSEPFPAKSAPPDARRDAYALAPSTAANGPKDQPLPASPAPAEARRDAHAAAANPEQETSARRARTTAQGRSPTATQVAESKVSNLDEAKAKQAGAGSVEAWIARIRELRNTAQLAAAARELEAFRATYGARADALLPRDLRDINTSDAKGQ